MFRIGASPLGCSCWDAPIGVLTLKCSLWENVHWRSHWGADAGPIGMLTLGCSWGRGTGHRWRASRRPWLWTGSDPTTSCPWSCTPPPAAGNLHPKSHSTTSLRLNNRKRKAHNAEGNLFQSLLHLRGEQTGSAPTLPSPAVDRSCAQGRTSSLNKYLSSNGRRGAQDAWGFPLLSVEFLAETKEKGWNWQAGGTTPKSHLRTFTHFYLTQKLGGAPKHLPCLILSLSFPAGASPCSRTDVTSEGNTDISGSPHPNTSPKSSPRTPDFLRHRQLPLLPGDTTEPAVDTVQDAQGPIYESIRYKSQKLSVGLEKPYRDDGDTGDGVDPAQVFVVQEEPCSSGSPIPVYARICKASRAPQHTVPNSIEPEEEAAPALPEKRFDIL